MTPLLYSEEGLIGEYNETGELIQSYGYNPDSPFSSNPIFSHRPDFTDAGGYGYYINDHLGTPKKLLTKTGRVIWFGESEAFGNTQRVNDEFRNPLRFPGQYFDEESGLHYNYFRYYDPELGRYITSDPIGLAGGINTYAYVEGNPLNAVDPTGLISFSGDCYVLCLGAPIHYAAVCVKYERICGEITTTNYGLYLWPGNSNRNFNFFTMMSCDEFDQIKDNPVLDNPYLPPDRS